MLIGHLRRARLRAARRSCAHQVLEDLATDPVGPPDRQAGLDDRSRHPVDHARLAVLSQDRLPAWRRVRSPSHRRRRCPSGSRPRRSARRRPTPSGTGAWRTVGGHRWGDRRSEGPGPTGTRPGAGRADHVHRRGRERLALRGHHDAHFGDAVEPVHQPAVEPPPMCWTMRTGTANRTSFNTIFASAAGPPVDARSPRSSPLNGNRSSEAAAVRDGWWGPSGHDDHHGQLLHGSDEGAGLRFELRTLGAGGLRQHGQRPGLERFEGPRRPRRAVPR